MDTAEPAFVLRFADYVDECQAAGIEPLPFDVLRELVLLLTDATTVH